MRVTLSAFNLDHFVPSEGRFTGGGERDRTDDLPA